MRPALMPIPARWRNVFHDSAGGGVDGIQTVATPISTQELNWMGWVRNTGHDGRRQRDERGDRIV